MPNLLRSTAQIIFGKILPQLPYRVVRGPLKGFKFILGANSGEGGGATIYFNLLEPIQTTSFTKVLKKGDILFDVGANVGLYTLLGSRLVGDTGKVFAFEPLVSNISYLHRHIKINKIKNVIIVPCACSDSLAIATFFHGPNNAVGHIENATGFNKANETAVVYTDETTIIPTLTLDAVADKLGITPTILKIDVEGAELGVLQGAKGIISNNKPVIYLSVHSDELRTTCLAYLSNFNYKFEALNEHSENAWEFLCTAKII